MGMNRNELRAALADDSERVAQIGSWAWDLRTQELIWSPHLYRIFGMDPDGPAATVESLYAVVHPDDAERLAASTEIARDRRHAPPIQYRILRADSGEVRTVVARGSRMLDEEGTLQRMVGTVEDVTDRVRREHQLTARSQLLEAAQELANVGTWQWYPSSDTHIWSDEMRRIAGRDSAFVPSRASIEGQIHPDDRPRFRASTASLASAGSIPPTPFRLERPDGDVRHIVTSVRRVDGPDPWFLGVVHDVTDLRRLQQGMQQRQTMEAVGQLASGVAHDFNNLLTVILGNAQLIEGEEDAPLVHDIVAAAEAGAELARRLLAVGRPSQLHLTPVHLRSQVEMAAAMLGRVLGPDVSLRTDLGETPTVSSDPNQIVQILLNLVMNAEQAGPRSGIIELSTGTDDDGWATVTVRDDGEGMGPETRRRAIEPFFTTRAPGGGSGLGLSMVYGVVNGAGGEVALQSALGVGTTVTLRFPPLPGGSRRSHGLHRDDRPPSGRRPRGGRRAGRLAPRRARPLPRRDRGADRDGPHSSAGDRRADRPRPLGRIHARRRRQGRTGWLPRDPPRRPVCVHDRLRRARPLARPIRGAAQAVQAP